MLFNLIPWKKWSILPIGSSYIMFYLMMQEMSVHLCWTKAITIISKIFLHSSALGGCRLGENQEQCIRFCDDEGTPSSSLLIGLGGEAAHPSEFCPDSQNSC